MARLDTEYEVSYIKDKKLVKVYRKARTHVKEIDDTWYILPKDAKILAGMLSEVDCEE